MEGEGEKQYQQKQQALKLGEEDEEKLVPQKPNEFSVNEAKIWETETFKDNQG